MAARVLARVLLLGAAACATEGGEPGGPRRPGTFRIVSEEPVSDISNVVRVKPESSASSADATFAYAKAKAAYDRNDDETAIAGFSAIALSATPDPEYCAFSANLALEAMAAKKDYAAMTRFSDAYEKSACEWAQYTHFEPPEQLVALESPALAALSFLEGCWKHWNVDWGFSLCWKKEGPRWVGNVKTRGVGAAIGRPEHVGLRISQDANGLVLAAGGTDWWLFRDLHRARVTLFDGGLTAAKPQQPGLSIRLADGVLTVGRQGDGATYKLKRER